MTEIVKQGGALAILPTQTNWTPDQAAALRQMGIKDQVAPAELSGFLHLCQRTGLDPFSRQIYLIGRFSKQAGREVYTPQTGIDGYRVIAQRVTSHSGGTYGYEDTLWCDPSGKWRDVWLADSPPAAAKAIVIRNGQRFSAVARFSEYAQTFPSGDLKGLWAKMPAGQIAKCAEALALRKAFPHDLAGVYTAEEMAQADSAPQPERHLRPVAAGEADQWATAQPERDFVAEARTATTADAVRKIWQEASAAGLDDTRLGHIAAVGKSLAAGPPSKAADADASVVDAEVVPEPEELEAQAAEAELRAFAEAAGLRDIERDFETAKGMPLAQAIAPQIRGFLAELGGITQAAAAS